MSALLALLLAIATPDGELCIVRADRTLPACRATSGRHFEIERARGYATWWNREATEAAVGGIDGETIDLTKWQPIAIELRVDAPATITIGDSDATLTIPAHRAASLRRLWLPRRETTLTFAADHHASVTRKITRETTSLGVVELKPLPLLTGTIVAAENEAPLAGAAIALPTGAVAATSDTSGRFRAWIEGEWPELLRITAADRAATDIAVPKVIASADLGVIRVGSGGTLRVQLGERELDVRLLREKREIAIRSGVHGNVDFERLPGGAYTIVLRGAQPLQQLAIAAEVRDGETTTVEAHIEPADLKVHVRSRNEGVRASIQLEPAAGEWQTAIATDDHGRFEGELWQRGEFVSFITAGEATIVRHDRLDGTREIEWNIDLPHLEIRGVVVDADGKAIAGADVTLDTDSGGTSTQSAETTGANGRFVFRGIEAGTQTLTASASGYVPSAITTTATNNDVDATIRLQRGTRRTIHVTRNGQPVANAIVLDDDGTLGELRTDAAGKLEITTAPGERRPLVILPPDGSFAISDADRIEVPPGAATIRITATNGANAPLPAMSFAIRYNGRMLTPWVRAMMRNRRGVPLQTGPDGVAMLTAMPPGLYEIWPYFRAEELARIASGLVAPKARIAAQPGTSEVRFTFEEE